MYFFLKPDHGKEREVSIRRLPLEGTQTFAIWVDMKPWMDALSNGERFIVPECLLI
jgi:hypothetical protein